MSVADKRSANNIMSVWSTLWNPLKPTSQFEHRMIDWVWPRKKVNKVHVKNKFLRSGKKWIDQFQLYSNRYIQTLYSIVIGRFY